MIFSTSCPCVDHRPTLEHRGEKREDVFPGECWALLANGGGWIQASPNPATTVRSPSCILSSHFPRLYRMLAVCFHFCFPELSPQDRGDTFFFFSQSSSRILQFIWGNKSYILVFILSFCGLLMTWIFCPQREGCLWAGGVKAGKGGFQCISKDGLHWARTGRG